MKMLSNWPTLLACLVAFLLPWQTRYIFGFEMIAGEVVQFGASSVYAVELLLLPFLFLLSWKPRAIIGVLALIVSVHAGFAALLFAVLVSARVDYREVVRAFCLGLIPSILLGLWQIVAGGSGASTLLGLAPRAAEQLGDAIVMFDGERVLRAYGSFPHPNIFGGFLAIGALIAAHLHEFGRRRWLLVSVLGFALLLTGSRSALLGFILGGVVALAIQVRPKMTRAIAGVAMSVAVATLVLSMVLPGIVAATRGGGATELRSLTERQEQYADYPSVLSTVNPLIGTGYDRYASALHQAHPDREWWEYQPIHNVPLLLFAEVGVIGIAVLLFVLTTFCRRRSIVVLPFFVTLFTIGLFDHYLWTQWSGLALVALGAAFAWRAHPQGA